MFDSRCTLYAILKHWRRSAFVVITVSATKTPLSPGAQEVWTDRNWCHWSLFRVDAYITLTTKRQMHLSLAVDLNGDRCLPYNNFAIAHFHTTHWWHHFRYHHEEEEEEEEDDDDDEKKHEKQKKQERKEEDTDYRVVQKFTVPKIISDYFFFKCRHSRQFWENIRHCSNNLSHDFIKIMPLHFVVPKTHILVKYGAPVTIEYGKLNCFLSTDNFFYYTWTHENKTIHGPERCNGWLSLRHQVSITRTTDSRPKWPKNDFFTFRL